MIATLGLVLLVITLGCTGAGARSRNSTVERDSAGIVVVENSDPYEEWHVGGSPAIQIGVVEGDSAYQFHRIAFAARLSDGRFVVANGGTNEIRWFGPGGAFRSKVGRQGQGPAEFGAIANVLLSPTDTLIVADPRNQRLTWIAPSETIVREEVTTALGSGAVTILGTDPDSAVRVAISTTTYEVSHPDINYTRDTLTVLRIRAARADTVLRIAGRESGTWVRFSEGRPAAMQQMSLPFAHPVLVAGSGPQIFIGRSEADQRIRPVNPCSVDGHCR